MPHCNRCDRDFVHNGALRQHLDHSSQHWLCNKIRCNFDGNSWDDLSKHKHSFACYGCRTIWVSEEAYKDHLEEENVCEHCDRHLDNRNSLIMHKLVHRTADIECILCGDEREFTTYSGLMIHLEAARCSPAVDIEDLNYAAAICRGWEHFVQEEHRRWLTTKNANYLTNSKIRPFKCPTCDTTFTKLSSMFQHIESPACSQTMTEWPISKLQKWLSKVITGLHENW